MPRQIDLETWRAYFDARRQGMSVERAARQAGMTPASGYRYEKGQSKSGSAAAAEIGYAGARRDHTDQLSPEAKRALKDFAYFRRRYLGRRTVPWQVDAANRVVEALNREDSDDYIVVNAPPGSGKSTTFTHDIAVWIICRNRNIRILLGSRTQRQANAYARRVRATLERTAPVKADSKALRLGMAVDAVATLAHDYGAFKPTDPDQWSVEQFRVIQEERSDEKEATVAAYGLDTGFLGGRFDLCLWDDVVDSANTRSIDMRTQLVERWEEYAETRLEPGGVLILQGQRIAAEDLYRHCLDKRNEDGAPMYERVVYAAHDESICQEFHQTKTPWPKTCLLDPLRLPWKKLAPIRATTPRKFKVMYQQEDVVGDSALIDPLWLDGGVHPETGHMHPGCWDAGRAMGEVPSHLLDGSAWSVVTVDPAPDNYWAVHWWVYHPGSQNSYLIRQIRRRMTSNQFLQMNLDTGEFSGVAHDLWNESVQAGLPLDYLIVEANAAQKFMLQNAIYQRWLASKTVHLLPHLTHVNKTDPRYGIEALQPLFSEGRIRLPGSKDALTLVDMKQLTYELTHYPVASTSDTVMACWFYVHHLMRTYRPKSQHYSTERPGWVRHGIQRGLHYGRTTQAAGTLRVRLPGGAA